MGLVSPLFSYQTCSSMKTKRDLHRSELNTATEYILKSNPNYIPSPNYALVNGERYFHGTPANPVIHHVETGRLMRPSLLQILKFENVDQIGILTEDYDLLFDCDIRIAALLATLNEHNRVQILAIHIKNKRGPEDKNSLSLERLKSASHDPKGMEDILLDNGSECQDRSRDWLKSKALTGMPKLIREAGDARMTMSELLGQFAPSDSESSERATDKNENVGRVKYRYDTPPFDRVRMPSGSRY